MADTVRFIPTYNYARIAYGALSSTTTVDITVPPGTSLIYYNFLATFERDSSAIVHIVRVVDSSTTSVLYKYNIGSPLITTAVVNLNFDVPGLQVFTNPLSSGVDKTISNDLKKADGTTATATVELTVGYALVPAE